MDPDAELLIRVNNTRDFFRSVCCDDALDDWNLAKEFGEFLVRILPDTEVMGHAVLARAHRHTGNLELALIELNECLARMRNRALEPWEVEMLLPMVREEEKFLSGATGVP